MNKYKIKKFISFIIIGSMSFNIMSCNVVRKDVKSNLKSIESPTNNLDVKTISQSDLMDINSKNITTLKEFLSAYEIPFLSNNDGTKETEICLDYESIRDNNLNMSHLNGLNYLVGDDNKFRCEFNISLDSDKEVQIKDTLLKEFYESFMGDSLPDSIINSWKDIIKDTEAKRKDTITLVDFYKDYMKISLKLTLDNIVTLEIIIPDEVEITD